MAGKKSINSSTSTTYTPIFFLVVIASTLLLSTTTTYNLLTAIKRNCCKTKTLHDQINGNRRLYHVVVTAEDNLYSQWQTRIMFYWYKKVKTMNGSDDMGGFTRLLHSGDPDELMDDIPTFVVQPLHWEFIGDYIVLNRPWAIIQWLQQAEIEEDYILMAEPDHIFIKPIPNLAVGNNPAGFPFNYMHVKGYDPTILRRFYPRDKGPLNEIQPIGSSPVIILKSQLEKIAPAWMITAIKINYDREADKAFGWIQEMFAYAIASALSGIQHVLNKDFMIHPAIDPTVKNSYIIHYTYKIRWPPIESGLPEEWSFDKRSYTMNVLPRNLSLPPLEAPQCLFALIESINEATANIPDWNKFKESH